MAGGARSQQEVPMTRRYDAFLIRYWSLDDDNRQRVEVTHIRSGARALVASLDNAMGWMQGRVEAGPNAGHEAEAAELLGRGKSRP
jgi:hypothetical protein